MFESNYPSEQFNFSFKFQNSKMNKFNHRNSFDAGYESILSSTSFSSNANTSRVNDSSLFSQPSTPIKQQQYVADVNGIYFASIRSSLANTTTDSFLSPIKTSNFGQFSASNSNSPVKLTNSPKFAINTDNYVHERDYTKSKLLRSPAFKLNNIIAPEVPQIKSFSSRFQLNYTTPLDSPVETIIRPTPTEEEFMQLLIKNKHLPSNPEFLIGRHMGLDHLDILGELEKRSLYNIIDQIVGYLNVTDCVRLACVSKEYRSMIKQNRKVNKQRVEFLKEKKRIYETTKENRVINEDEGRLKSNRKFNSLTLEEKRNLLKNYRMHNSACLDEEEGGNFVKNSNGSFVFVSLDLNTLNNISTGATSFSEFNQNLSLNRKAKKQTRHDEDVDMVCEQESPSKKHKAKISNEISNELFNACNSLFHSVNKNNNSKMSELSEKPKRSGLLERDFKQFSIDEEIVCEPRPKPKVACQTAAIQIAENSPQFIVKNLKLSPSKRQPSLDTSSCTQSKIDLIGSKKSKKNLKRL